MFYIINRYVISRFSLKKEYKFINTYCKTFIVEFVEDLLHSLIEILPGVFEKGVIEEGIIFLD